MILNVRLSFETSYFSLSSTSSPAEQSTLTEDTKLRYYVVADNIQQLIK